MKDNKTCIICNSHSQIKSFGIQDRFEITCPRCGKYFVTWEARLNAPAIIDEKYADKRNILSGVLRERFETNKFNEIITTDNFETIIQSVKLPTTLQERFDKIILYLYNKSKVFYESIEIKSSDYSIGYANGEDEFNHMLKELGVLRLIGLELVQAGLYRIKLITKGFERAEYLIKNYVTSEIVKEFSDGKTSLEISAKNNMNENIKSNSNMVFIVHGHDKILKNELQIFLSENGLDPIILHRKEDEGLTIIEKFEKHSNVQYAFVLLTPDDMGYEIKENKKDDKNRKKELRARQNVIFELGYFVGKLGRSKVCCIYKKGVSLPNDMSGLIYKEVDKSIDEIGYKLIKEMNKAGIKTKLGNK